MRIKFLSMLALMLLSFAVLAVSSEQEKFDGRVLYKRAFEEIRGRHIGLSSPEKLKKFSLEWEHKFDKSADLGTEEGTDRAISKMLESLGQRFDYYLDRDAALAEDEAVDASLSGIGATLRLSKLPEFAKSIDKEGSKKQQIEEFKKATTISHENSLVIDETIKGSPAQNVGLQAGDLIRRVDGVELAGIKMNDAVKLIKGRAGTKVKLTVERCDQNGKNVYLEFLVTRAFVKIPDVSFRELANGVAYIKLRDFMSKSAVEEMAASLNLASASKGLILDLRGNPGGSLTSVLSISAMILEDGPVLITRFREGQRLDERELSLNKNFVIRQEPSEKNPSHLSVGVDKRPPLLIPAELPLIVLVDGGSASASEILSGALQYNKRAVIIGMPTVGKGVGQDLVSLPYGRRMHVTSFEFIPGRLPNDWIGVIPDLKIERGVDPKADEQLDKAQEMIGAMIAKANELELQRENLFKKNKRDFEESLIEREKGL